jgi:hypothetical protein
MNRTLRGVSLNFCNVPQWRTTNNRTIWRATH